jgi:hypothetical protein
LTPPPGGAKNPFFLKILDILAKMAIFEILTSKNKKNRVKIEQKNSIF